MGRFRNTAAAAVDQPPPSKTMIINQNEPGKAGLVLALGVITLVFGFVLWHVALLVLDEMGFRNPVASLGWGVFYLLCIFVVVWLPAKALEKLVGMGLSTWKEVRQSEYEAKVQLHRINLQLAQSTPIATTRTLGDDARKVDIVQAIMGQAYEFIDNQKRNFTHNDAKPWTWSTAKGLEVNGKPITETEARQIKYWLQEMGIVIGNEVDLERYPDMNAVNKYLSMNFALPVVYGGRSLPSSVEDRGYEHINENP